MQDCVVVLYDDYATLPAATVPHATKESFDMQLDELKGGVPWINIEGGPCAGKTTALAAICQWCQDHGFTPIIVPEAATNLIGSGLDPTTPLFQELVLRNIVHDVSIRMEAIRAQSITKPVLIFDSGFARGRAYVSEAAFEKALDTVGLSFMAARDIYDGVIFLDSAAVGAEEFYTTANNETRRETVEQAREINQRTLDTWIGSPHIHPIPNIPNQTFEQKIRKCIKALARSLGVPEPLEIERKFLLHNFDLTQLEENVVPIDVLQTYLLNYDSAAERVRARGQHDHWFYFNTIKQEVAPGVANELDRMIAHSMYERLLVRRMVDKSPIIKTRRCQVLHGHYLEFDSFHGHREGLHLLEVEVADLKDDLSMIIEQYDCTEVTSDPTYSNYALADPVKKAA